MESRLTIRQYADRDEDINATLNRIAILAKKEVEDYYMRICDNNKYRTRIEAHYIPLIERLAKDNWHKINNEVHFIDDCFRRIRYAIRTFDVERGDFDKRVKYFIYRSLRDYCGRRGEKRDKLTLIEDSNVFKALDCTDATEEKAIGNASTYEETYARLYENICVKKIDFIVLDTMIHTAEDYDKITEAEISRALSKKTGRSFDSARSTIRSFKKRLRKRNVRREDIIA
ncbi:MULTISPECIES: hypothetical protein [Bacillus]|uniref:Sigma-70 family RNA polymerase sigma factor n=1 Tax=Bacillus thuringiensis serovar toumanoffi TaxID=180862 RepID=A0ABD5I8E0_BACTU|nr:MULTISPECIES: hypothetical protein [Bacillus]EEM93470.1 hypothetical protein bthur0013_51100 [Bacillus thuringiensis IBL 200]MCR6783161.1 hypothetical protein [Bacillus thuringiensis]MCR6845251.1 hypothetical protein [Bacillus sp. IBL03825]MCR6861234.1 hypothetical protein [Bacillus thuringiensis]MCR6863546.1 hypothetical protein [Bacillus thuringiensis]